MSHKDETGCFPLRCPPSCFPSFLSHHSLLSGAKRPATTTLRPVVDNPRTPPSQKKTFVWCGMHLAGFAEPALYPPLPRVTLTALPPATFVSLHQLTCTACHLDALSREVNFPFCTAPPPASFHFSPTTLCSLCAWPQLLLQHKPARLLSGATLPRPPRRHLPILIPVTLLPLLVPPPRYRHQTRHQTPPGHLGLSLLRKFFHPPPLRN